MCYNGYQRDMIIAQKTYKHKVLLLMKVGLAVFMVVIFLAQNANSRLFEANNFAYKKLNANETQYFLNSLNALPQAGEGQVAIQGLNLELLSQQISEQIKTSVEPLLLQEASIVKLVSPSFDAHQNASNVLMYSFIFGVLAVIIAEKQKLLFKNDKSMRLKKILVSISPRSPNSTI